MLALLWSYPASERPWGYMTLTPNNFVLTTRKQLTKKFNELSEKMEKKKLASKMLWRTKRSLNSSLGKIHFPNLWLCIFETYTQKC